MTGARVAVLLLMLAIGVGGWFLTCAAWRFDAVAAGVVPLDPRTFDRLTVVTLGTGGAYENQNRLGPSTALALGRDVVLVDAGRGVAEALRASQIPVSQPTTVLLTSGMPANTLGLDDLLVMGWVRGREQPLALVGPPGTEATARAVEAGVAAGVAAWKRALDTPGTPRFEVVEVEGPFEMQVGGLSLRAAPLPGGPTPTLAWRAAGDDADVVVSAAGWGADALAGFARGADLLVHDAAMVPTPEVAREMGLEEDPEQLRREAALHTDIASVGGIARRAGVEALVLVRLRPPPVFDFQITSQVGGGYEGRVLVADDGEEFHP